MRAHFGLMILLGLLVLGGCAMTQQASSVDHLRSVPGGARILLFDPDIRFYVLTAGGVPEPQPDWTDAAQLNFLNAVRTRSAQLGLGLTLHDAGVADEELVDYEKLHQAVGQTILANHLGPLKLPAKAGRFDYTLGPGAVVLKERYGADYGLFVFYRDYRASGGRMAFSILAAAVGVAVPPGGQGGFASLVDLTTGDVVWFNQVSVGTGDLRESEGAAKTVDVLLEKLPRG